MLTDRTKQNLNLLRYTITTLQFCHKNINNLILLHFILEICKKEWQEEKQ